MEPRQHPARRPSRRPARTAALLAAIATLAALAPLAAAPPPRRSVTYPLHAMGTYVHVTIVTADSLAALPAARAAHAAVRLVDSLMSNWTTTSEVARLNRVADSVETTVEPHVAEVLARALALWRESDGAYDITVEPLVRAWGFLGGRRRVPEEAEARAAFALVGAGGVRFDSTRRTIRFERRGMRVDLGGIAKGYAVELAMRALERHGVRDALVDASGNMRSAGSPAASPAWRIGLRDPHDRQAWFARVTLSGDAISTSASYEQFVARDGRRYGHILDPRSGRPAEGLLAVTVVAPDATTADAWDTPLYVLGPEAARRKARERDDVAAILVVPGPGQDTVWVEEALRDRFRLEPAAAERFTVRWF
jgi:thiamine biosynthesis lipoprotein